QRGDSLMQLCFGSWACKDREVCMGVDIDEPGCDDLAGGVDDRLRRWSPIVWPGDPDNRIALDHDICAVGIAAGTVDDASVRYQYVAVAHVVSFEKARFAIVSSG